MRPALNVEVRIKATSQFTVETIDRRLAAIAGRTDPEAEREREFLARVRPTAPAAE